MQAGQTGGAKQTTEDVLARLAQDERPAINKAWPEREPVPCRGVTSLKDLIVMRLDCRTNSALGLRWDMERKYGKTGRSWHEVGADDLELMHPAPRSSVEIYPVYSGGSERARFLVRGFYTGCAGSSGLVYQVYEWQPEYGVLASLLTQEGSQGMDPAAWTGDGKESISYDRHTTDDRTKAGAALLLLFAPSIRGTTRICAWRIRTIFRGIRRYLCRGLLTGRRCWRWSGC